MDRPAIHCLPEEKSRKRLLKPNAVPDCNLPTIEVPKLLSKTQLVVDSNSIASQESHVIDHDYVSYHNDAAWEEHDYARTESFEYNHNLETHNYQNITKYYETKIKKLTENCEHVIRKFSALKKKYKLLQKENFRLKTTKHQVTSLKKKIHTTINPSTIDHYFHGNKRSTIYSREDIAVAAVLKSISKKAYNVRFYFDYLFSLYFYDLNLQGLKEMLYHSTHF